jgi:ribonuclease D
LNSFTHRPINAQTIRRSKAITITLHKGDLPADLKLEGDIAIDTEAMGLNNHRDRLCVVQLSTGDGNVHLVQFAPGAYEAPNLKRLLSNPKTTKLFHFARFDVAIIHLYLGVLIAPVYCTRTASRLARTFTDRHGLKDICRDLIGKDISKQQQSSDWGASELTQEQKEYAAGDVLYLHQLRTVLDGMLAREGRAELAKACFDFIPARAMLDIAGWAEVDIFAHS